MILIDTSPLVALCDGRDAQHRTAIKQFERLGAQEVGTCEAVLMEACFHLPHRHQRQRLRALLEAFRIGPIATTLEADFWRDVFDWLVTYAEHDPDWADGCIAVLRGRDRSTKSLDLRSRVSVRMATAGRHGNSACGEIVDRSRERTAVNVGSCGAQPTWRSVRVVCPAKPREAKTLASLYHPHLAAIAGSKSTPMRYDLVYEGYTNYA